MRVTVLGAGSWGTTVASLVAAHHETLLWARDADVAGEINAEHTHSKYLAGFDLPVQLRATDDLQEAAEWAQVLVMGVPSQAFRSTLEEIRPYLHPWIPVVSLTKGLEHESLLRMTQVIEDVLPGHPPAALTGPNLAKEIMAGQAAASVIATDDLAIAGELQRVFRRGVFRVYTNHDVVGCELGGALKNVIAISAGMAQGLGVGDNTRSMVISRGLAEVTRIGTALGGEAQTFAGLTGLGDLLATCMSPQSRNRTVGERLGAGMHIDEVLAGMSNVAEGVKTAPSVMTIGERHGLELPISTQVHRVCAGEIDVAEAYRGLKLRPGHEFDPD
ncbi:MAG: NAD(P)H-dependent glycerol-3-phosphate dehydrogenase [Actinomycetota bacterium]